MSEFLRSLKRAAVENAAANSRSKATETLSRTSFRLAKTKTSASAIREGARED